MLGTKQEQKYYPVFVVAAVVVFVILAILVLQLATSVSNLIISNRATRVTIQSDFVVAPEWQAVRDQYEITYPRTASTFVVAPEWQAVRYQYDVSGFVPYIAPPAWAFAQAKYAASISGFVHGAFAPVTFVVAPEWQAVRNQYEITYPATTANFIVAPEWQAVRNQYEITYARTTSTFVVAPEWQAVRDQYEITYSPVIQSLPTFVVAPEWIALRQQYEGGYGYTSPEVRRP